jgi:hypothetical protein
MDTMLYEPVLGLISNSIAPPGPDIDFMADSIESIEDIDRMKNWLILPTRSEERIPVPGNTLNIVEPMRTIGERSIQIENDYH